MILHTFEDIKVQILDSDTELVGERENGQLDKLKTVARKYERAKQCG